MQVYTAASEGYVPARTRARTSSASPTPAAKRLATQVSRDEAVVAVSVTCSPLPAPSTILRAPKV